MKNLKLVVLLSLSAVACTSASAFHLDKPETVGRTSLDLGGFDDANKPFRFYNYNTGQCIQPDGTGKLVTGGSCSHDNEIFIFYGAASGGIGVKKFMHRPSGKCVGVGTDPHAHVVNPGDRLHLQDCTDNPNGPSLLQEWREQNHWQGGALYYLIEYVGLGICMTTDDGWASDVWIQGCDYYNNNQWWSLWQA